MKEELDALEQPLKRGLVLRLMCNPTNRKRSACLEDPKIKPAVENEHSYHGSILLGMALRGVMDVFRNGGGLTESEARFGSATPADKCDIWLLEGNTIWARYSGDKFVCVAKRGATRKYKKAERETLALAYEDLNSQL